MIVMKKDESMGKGDNWKTYMVNEMKPGPVCSNMIQVIFFKQFKDIKWDITCTFKPVSRPVMCFLKWPNESNIFS